jgi:hypothetical protein
MADKTTSSRKKPVSQKRVAVVLASLVATLTFSAAALLLMEGSPAGGMPAALAQARSSVAAQIETAVPLQRGAWNYIIIYESGDLAGSAAGLADGVLTGDGTLRPNTIRPKANFHFVIDSAQSRRRDAVDGELEVGAAWMNQEAGAPYAGWPDVRYHTFSPYKNAVGVCFIGDLGREPMSDAQHRSLVQVVRELQNRLNIPNGHVHFQWELEPNVNRANSAQKAFADYFRASME